MSPFCAAKKTNKSSAKASVRAKPTKINSDVRTLLAAVPTPLRRISGKRSFEALAQAGQTDASSNTNNANGSTKEEMARKKGSGVMLPTASSKMSLQAAIKKTWKMHTSYHDLFQKQPGRRAPDWYEACEAAAERAAKNYDELVALFEVLSEGGMLQWEDTETPAGCSYEVTEIHGVASKATQGRSNRTPLAAQAREALLGVCSMLAAHKHMSWLEAYDGEEPNHGYFAHALFAEKHSVRIAGLSKVTKPKIPPSSSLSTASTSAAASPTSLPSSSTTPSPVPSPSLAPLSAPMQMPMAMPTNGGTSLALAAEVLPGLGDLALTASESDSEVQAKQTQPKVAIAAPAKMPTSFACGVRPACLMVNARLPLWKALEGTDSGGPLKEMPSTLRSKSAESEGLQLALQELDYSDDLGKWGSLPEERIPTGSLVAESALNELLWSQDKEVLVIKVYASLLPRGVPDAPVELNKVVREELLKTLAEAKAAGQAVMLQLGGGNPHLLACKVYLTEAFTSLGLRCGYLRWRADSSHPWAREQRTQDRVCLGLLLP
mmetsp:Transcript_50090/g.106550  ORF Transcript_50090/g.106550 Transcript_50090/m.106550 type:complete len:548 (+) Transcript_50090:213-1856(+)